MIIDDTLVVNNDIRYRSLFSTNKSDRGKGRKNRNKWNLEQWIYEYPYILGEKYCRINDCIIEIDTF